MRTPALLFAVLILVAEGCKREIPISTRPEPISGFRVDGTVSDALGRPIQDIPIRLFFDEFSLESTGPEPSRSYDVQTPGEVVDVHVFDAAGTFIRSLFSGPVFDSQLTVIWDRKLADDSDAPSGKYTVRYLVGGAERKSYLVLVYGTVTARSDLHGRFTIPQERLPLNQSDLPVYSANDQFLGIYRIGRRIELEFVAGSSARSVFVVVEEDYVTRVSVVL